MLHQPYDYVAWPICCSRNPQSHLGLGRSGFFPLFGFSRIAFGLSFSADSHGTHFYLNITLSLALCLLLPASFLGQQYRFLFSRLDTSTQVHLVFFVFLSWCSLYVQDQFLVPSISPTFFHGVSCHFSSLFRSFLSTNQLLFELTGCCVDYILCFSSNCGANMTRDLISIAYLIPDLIIRYLLHIRFSLFQLISDHREFLEGFPFLLLF